jgi:DNA-binding NtrC family response regulator
MEDTIEVRRTRRVRLPRCAGPWQLEIGTPSGSRLVSLGQGQSVVLGSGSGVDVRVDDEAVSSRHVELHAREDGLAVVDLGSTNGTYVGAARVARAVLTGTSGTIVLGRTTLAVQLGQGEIRDPGRGRVPGLIGSSFAMRRLAADVARYAPLRAPVLVVGETGSGKEVVARGLHELSGRSGAFVPVNVGGLSESLADAELFGHSRGAFTGAVTARIGAFQQADEGTLFLDEIADLSPGIQVKLLRVLEERIVRPIGAGPVAMRARIISACWALLDDGARPGPFRTDLYHRISTVILRIPPLRERKSDLAELARCVLQRHESELGSKEITPGGLARLACFDWPGNVRQLAAVLYRAAAATPGPVVDAHHVDAAMPGAKRKPVAMSPAAAAHLLAQHGHNVSKAARAAGVPRGTFRGWLRRARATEPS